MIIALQSVLSLTTNSRGHCVQNLKLKFKRLSRRELW